MSKSNSFETSLLQLIFNATAITGLADDASSSPLTSLYLSLHTSDPGEAGTAVTNEVGDTGYARKAVLRSTGGFIVSSGTASLAEDVTFDQISTLSNDITHFAVVTTSDDAGTILYSGTVTPNISAGSNVTPKLTDATTITED